MTNPHEALKSAVNRMISQGSPIFECIPPTMTTVKELGSEREFRYNLPPREALRACYEQTVKKNYNWWDYKDLSCYPIVSSARTISLVDLVVVKGAEQCD